MSYIFKDGQIPVFTSERILYLQEYIQPVGNLVFPCNTFSMLVLSLILTFIFLSNVSVIICFFAWKNKINTLHKTNPWFHDKQHVFLKYGVVRGSVVKCLTRSTGVRSSSCTGSSSFRGSVLGQDAPPGQLSGERVGLMTW